MSDESSPPPEAAQQDAPPPQELTWDSTLRDLFNASYDFSDNLLDPERPPSFIRMYGDRWAVRWQGSGVPDPEAQTTIDVYITVRPVAPATITIKV